MNTYVYTVYILCDSIYDMYVNLEIYIYTCSVFGIIYIYIYSSENYHGSQKGGWEYACPFKSLRVSVYIC